jgi:hypothetical protein
MRDWSPKDAIALERRHIVEGEQQVARQEMLLRQVTAWGRENLIEDATEVLRLLRKAVDLSRARLRDLEDRYVGDHNLPITRRWTERLRRVVLDRAIG